MIGGAICTRSCKFCNTLSGKPLPLDTQEPERVAESVRLMKLDHAVVTSVDRDDLPDLGAAHWAATIKAIKEVNPNTTLETLIPDFQGREELIRMVTDARPDIISHNMETVRRISPLVRSVATYDRSLEVIRQIAESGITTKSGIMVGLGETPEEVEQTMDDLLANGCRILTIGQYLQPSRKHYPVHEYVTPEQFARYKETGEKKGFATVESGPLVRSSYHAENTSAISEQFGKEPCYTYKKTTADDETYIKIQKQDSIARTVAYHSNTDMFAFFPKYNSAGNRFYSLPRSAVIRHCTPEGSEFFLLLGSIGIGSCFVLRLFTGYKFIPYGSITPILELLLLIVAFIHITAPEIYKELQERLHLRNCFSFVLEAKPS